MKSGAEDDTVELQRPRSFSNYFFAPDDQRFDVQVAAATHRGRIRRRNEDHYAVVRRKRSCEILLTNLPKDDLTLVDGESYDMVVADGIGGAANGDFASRLALQTMLELASRATSWLTKYTDLDAQEVRQRVAAYLEQMQSSFHEHGRADPDMRGMGTTWTSAHLLPPHAVVVHVGDSRAYLHRGGQLNQLTRDQTLAQEMIDSGMAPEDVVRFGHLLTNSLGGDAESVEAEVIHVELKSDDRLLLCTDGLTNMVSDAAIASVLESHEPQSACDQLVQLALEGAAKTTSR